MKKINKTICLDEEICKQLINENASELINRLLREHFNKFENMNEQELNLFIKKKEIELEAKNKIKELNNGE
jgi:hypothetical protein